MKNDSTPSPMPLTPKETALLKAIVEGMDEPGCGWLHELAPVTMSPRSAAGVLGSLVKRGLVKTYEEDGCSWVALAAA